VIVSIFLLFLRRLARFVARPRHAREAKNILIGSAVAELLWIVSRVAIHAAAARGNQAFGNWITVASLLLALLGFWYLL
jgi:hypothetical protein